MQSEKIVFDKEKSVKIVAKDIEGLKDNEILIKAKYSLISIGTEMVSLLGKRRKGNDFPSYPGYSLVGEIVEAGKDIKKYKAGDIVWASSNHETYPVIEPDDSNCILLSDKNSLMDYTFTALGKVALHGVRRLNVELNESAAVFGLGIVGQLVVQIAKASGAAPVIGIDLLDERCAIAGQCGADFVFGSKCSDVVEEIKKANDNKGVRVAVETSGSTKTMPYILKVSDYGARIGIVGGLHEDLVMDLYTEVQVKELSLIGCRLVSNLPQTPKDYWNLVQNYKNVISMITAGTINVKPLISKVVKFKDSAAVYNDLIAGRNKNLLGVVIDYT
ncbi:MAG: hypothetical protein A2231_12695 [Candidatus Firestonebacteria bacterium RIFOXYA2_FULL_40_8]|nr:MAG: hypothetical protein A2231_12695 [Candidatus Firestonebacteria bacterium RIFOXYA2_FULL_40_8]